MAGRYFEGEDLGTFEYEIHRQSASRGLAYFSVLNPRQYFSTQDAIDGPEDLAQGYVYYKDKYQKASEVDYTAISGAGSIVTNVLDYSKWLKAQLSQSGSISREGYKALRTPRIAASYDTGPQPFTGPENYALGWSNGVYKGYEWFEHGGGTISFGTELIFFPALNYGVVMFGNTAGTSTFAESVLLWHLVDEKLRISKEERFDFNQKYVLLLYTSSELLSSYSRCIQV